MRALASSLRWAGAMMKSLFVVSSLACLGLGCGSNPKPSSPDAPPPAADAMPQAPDATSLATIGVGATPCKGASDPTKQVDMGPVLPDEIGDPAAARITPTSYPFKVESVSYQLTGQESMCGTNIAHTVTVYAAPTGTTLPATPTDPQTIQIAATAADQRTEIVTAQLPTPIVLQQGQDLVVAVAMDANAAKTVSICMDGCPITGGADDNRAFWSEMPQAPFTWATMYSYGIAEDYAIWAQGEAQ
jgi:hypothetical protein